MTISTLVAIKFKAGKLVVTTSVSVKSFYQLSDPEKWYCSLMLVKPDNRGLHKEVALIAFDELHKHKFIGKKISQATAEDLLDNLTKLGFLQKKSDTFYLTDVGNFEEFIFPLESEQRQQLLQCCDSFHTRAVKHRFYWYGYYDRLGFLMENARFLYEGKVQPVLRPYAVFNQKNLGTMREGSLGTCFSETWFSKLPDLSQIRIFLDFYNCRLFSFTCKNAIELPIYRYFLADSWLKSSDFCQFAAPHVAEYLILRGEFTRVKAYISASTSPEMTGIKALHDFICNDSETAVAGFKASFKRLKKLSGRRNIAFQTLADPFYLIALLLDGSPDSISEAKDWFDKSEKCVVRFSPFHSSIFQLLRLKAEGDASISRLRELISGSFSLLNCWLGCLILYWLGEHDQNFYKVHLLPAVEAAIAHGFEWVAIEGLLLLEKVGLVLSEDQQRFLANGRPKILNPLIDRFKNREKWETILDAVEIAMAQELPEAKDIKLFWVVEKYAQRWRVSPFEQKRLKSGGWSKGKAANYRNYAKHKEPYPDCYNEIDRKTVDILVAAEDTHEFCPEGNLQALAALAGSDKVFDNDFESRRTITREQPALVLSGNKNQLLLGWKPSAIGKKLVVEEDKDAIKVFEFSPMHNRISALLKPGSKFPMQAMDRLHHILTGLSSEIKVITDFDNLKARSSFEKVAADYRVHARLLPVQDGLRVSLRIAPVPASSTVFVPGIGLAEVIVEAAGSKLHVVRDWASETAMVNQVIDKCSSLQGLETTDFTGDFPDPSDALQLLLELQQLSEISIDWPENYKPKKISQASFANLKFRLTGENDWFTVDGDLAINENQVIEMRQLLQQYDGKSRFLTIDEQHVLALTEDFRRRLNDLTAFSEDFKGKRRFSRAALPAMEEILAASGSLTSDKAWKTALEKFRDFASLHFKVPASFTAELREYQHEGFVWLSRLAALGLGACLADDMGLGKTIEALALILSRAPQGPTLVIAPTSVCANWMSEAGRFAPTLRPIMFAQADRAAVIRDLAAYDLLICSYGIMQNEIETLAAVEWQTVVLDEAQSIKNMNTGRSQAAMKLCGGFKMLMTGTPIENHLGELWNLFNFINPGLLGSFESFNKKFAQPIQVAGDRQVQQRLKRLVQPFVLRRSKSQVLEDLPEKTEITLQVELSSEESALYESIRRESIKRISNCDSGSKPMQILAEIMRLRRACCNPALVVPDTKIASSKMALLNGIVEELLENQHRALIFSQFVDHLHLVRQMFDEKKITYQYLDGSTPPKARAKAVAEFQTGSSNFFLISLKAGGLGINLTAADYVIHLDPWWNPAVEDQASDRAYRIGQTRPVTIYRLITAGTIEDRIVALHARKRELADGLLSGTDLAARISAKDLLELLQTK